MTQAAAMATDSVTTNGQLTAAWSTCGGGLHSKLLATAAAAATVAAL